MMIDRVLKLPLGVKLYAYLNDTPAFSHLGAKSVIDVRVAVSCGRRMLKASVVSADLIVASDAGLERRVRT